MHGLELLSKNFPIVAACVAIILWAGDVNGKFEVVHTEIKSIIKEQERTSNTLEKIQDELKRINR